MDDETGDGLVIAPRQVAPDGTLAYARPQRRDDRPPVGELLARVLGSSRLVGTWLERQPEVVHQLAVDLGRESASGQPDRIGIVVELDVLELQRRTARLIVA